MTTTKPRGHRMKLLRDLGDTDLSKHIEVTGLIGVLEGIVPCGGRVQLVLNVGGARAYTAALPAGEGVEVWKVAAS